MKEQPDLIDLLRKKNALLRRLLAKQKREAPYIIRRLRKSFRDDLRGALQ